MSASLISAKEAKKQIKKFVDKEVERHLNTIGLKIMSAIKSGKESIIYIGYEGYIYPRKHNENIIIDVSVNHRQQDQCLIV